MSNILILGLGKSGLAVAKWCEKHSLSFVVYDDKNCTAKDYSLSDISTCVVSPGISPDHAVYKECVAAGIEIISEVEFALRLMKEKPPKMIGVTGTNGKTTVVELLTHIFNCAGFSCEAIGNIGRPVVDIVDKPYADVFVVELSSFQLLNTFSPLFAFGCWLNLSPNHLDWHKTMDEYAMAKSHLATLVRPHGSFLCHESLRELLQLHPVSCFQFGIHANNLKSGSFIAADGVLPPSFSAIQELPRKLRNAPLHDVENYLAAWHLAIMGGVCPEIVSNSYESFDKPNHRIQFVAEKDGVSFWDDSKATNIAATMAAVAAMKTDVVLIAGGIHKGASYAPWKKAFQGKVKKIVAIGQAKERIAADVGDEIPVVFASTLQEAVLQAQQGSLPSYAVLLSPGCSSYDMFIDYKDRGRQFQSYVRGRYVDY